MASNASLASKLSGSRLAFLNDLLHGMRQPQKSIPSKYLYDKKGSALFDAICEQPEYYLTLTELAIMEKYVDQMAARLGPECFLIEFGSGSSVKSQLLLAHSNLNAYAPVDISEQHLRQSVAPLHEKFPAVEIMPIAADFTKAIDIPNPSAAVKKRVVYFPGSTIGNFTDSQALQILKQIRAICGSDGGLLIGFDLQKEKSVLEAAYNDQAGVTAAFTMNLLKRINRELPAHFQSDGFEHHAIFNPAQHRIEISLRSLEEQSVMIADQVFELRESELIRTEYSHKYTIDSFAKLAEQANFSLQQHWSDEQQHFAVAYLA